MEKQTARRVLAKLNKFVRGGIFDKMALDWIEDAHRNGLFKTLSMQEYYDYLDTLKMYGNSSFHDEA